MDAVSKNKAIVSRIVKHGGAYNDMHKAIEALRAAGENPSQILLDVHKKILGKEYDHAVVLSESLE